MDIHSKKYRKNEKKESKKYRNGEEITLDYVSTNVSINNAPKPKGKTEEYYYKQISYLGNFTIGVSKSIHETNAIISAIFDAEMLTGMFSKCKDTFDALLYLKEFIYRANAWKLVPKSPQLKLRYSNSWDHNNIYDEFTMDCIFDLCAKEILMLSKDLHDGKTSKDLIKRYLKHSSFSFLSNNISERDLLLFEQYYHKGMLNDIINYICGYSNTEDGFIDYSVGNPNEVLFDKNPEDYLKK